MPPKAEGVGFEPTRRARRRRRSRPLPMPAGGPLQSRKRRDSNSQRTRARYRFSGPAPHPAGSLPRAVRREASMLLLSHFRTLPEQEAGFEPAKAFATGFADRPLRPLGNPCVITSHRLPARPEGFEPPTPGFGVTVLYQLSYRRIPSSTPGRNRTPDIRFWRPALYQLSYRRIPSHVRTPTMRPEGFEPPPSGFVIRRSAPAELQAHTIEKLSHSRAFPRTPKRLEGFEPSASGLAVRRSGQLSYRRIYLHFMILRSRGSPARRRRKTHGTGSRVRQTGGFLPRRVSTRTALLTPRTRVVKKRERRPAFPGTSGEAGRLCAGA